MLSYPGEEEGLGPGGRGRVTKRTTPCSYMNWIVIYSVDSENYMSSMCMKENNDAKVPNSPYY